MEPNANIVAPSDVSSVTDEPQKPIDWIEILSVLWGSRKSIAYATGGATVLSVVWFSRGLIFCMVGAAPVPKESVVVGI